MVCQCTGGTLTLCTNEGYPVLDSNNQPINLPAGISAEKVIVSENGKWDIPMQPAHMWI